MTNRRDRLPTSIKGHYLQKKKVEANEKTKCARYIEPIVAVNKQVHYDIVLTSFQSTSSCNIMCVNGINGNRNFVEARTRGRGDRKRHYVIEQNMARLLYLKTYSRIDSIDHLIKNCRMRYNSWKYWHSPANHGKSLAVTVAYDMYLECTEGELNVDWKVNEPVDFHTFRDILSRQMLSYDPKNERYPGDAKMRVVTQLSRKRRHSPQKESRESNLGGERTSMNQYRQAIREKRFCEDLASYEKHLCSLKITKHGVKCFVCGNLCYKKCVTCKVSLHHFDRKGDGHGKNCFLQYHSSNYFGICFGDRALSNMIAKEWKPWTKPELRHNIQRIKGFEDVSRADR